MLDYDGLDESRIDASALDEAFARLRRGEMNEALIWLERAHEAFAPLARLHAQAVQDARMPDASPRQRIAA